MYFLFLQFFFFGKITSQRWQTKNNFTFSHWKLRSTQLLILACILLSRFDHFFIRSHFVENMHCTRNIQPSCWNMLKCNKSEFHTDERVKIKVGASMTRLKKKLLKWLIFLHIMFFQLWLDFFPLTPSPRLYVKLRLL